MTKRIQCEKCKGQHEWNLYIKCGICKDHMCLLCMGHGEDLICNECFENKILENEGRTEHG